MVPIERTLKLSSGIRFRYGITCEYWQFLTILQLREAKRANFKGIPDEDIRTLQMDVEDMGYNLEMSKKYLDSAYQAFNQLKADIDAERWSHQCSVAAISTGCLTILTIGGG